MPRLLPLSLLLLLLPVSAQQVGFSPSSNTSFPLAPQVKEAPSAYPHSAFNQLWQDAGVQLLTHPLFTLAAIICLVVSISLLTACKFHSACTNKKPDPDVKVLMQAKKSEETRKTTKPLIRRFDQARPLDPIF